MNIYAVIFLSMVAGFVAGIWVMAWAQRERERHEHASDEQARQYEKDFPQ